MYELQGQIKGLGLKMTSYCTRCGKKKAKWFETWYAQGNCNCLFIENETIGSRDEVY
jgi:hypothetical protein